MLKMTDDLYVPGYWLPRRASQTRDLRVPVVVGGNGGCGVAKNHCFAVGSCRRACRSSRATNAAVVTCRRRVSVAVLDRQPPRDDLRHEQARVVAVTVAVTVEAYGLLWTLSSFL